jgi:nucleoside-specific outer membrane channel protein Tsx
MKILQEIDEDEVISIFLRAEYYSDRFNQKLSAALKSTGNDKNLIIHPNISDQKENEARREIMGKYRGFGQNRDLFENFPQEINWFRVIISSVELNEVLFINWDYWKEITDGTRRPVILAKKIKSKKIQQDEEIGRFENVAKALDSGKQFNELIMVAKDRQSRFVVLEGHVRLTAYYLSQKGLPNELEAIVGFSEQIDAWGNY